MSAPHGTPKEQGAGPRPWPRLGDLALDIAHGRIGVIVGVPGEQGSAWLTFHLQPPGGGPEWSAPADGSTLRPVSSPITHATAGAGPVHDRRARHWVLPIQVHHDDGGTQDSTLTFTEDQARHLVALVRDQDTSREIWAVGTAAEATSAAGVARVADLPGELRDINADLHSSPPEPSPTAAATFFSWLASTLPVTHAACLVITHVLPGQMDFLTALGHTTKIAAVLPKPKSANQLVVEKTAAALRCDLLDRGRFADPGWVIDYVRKRAEGRRIVLSDVGGYFAPALGDLCEALPGQIAGVVEDTENGHRRYEALLQLPCPVYSVARSPLKEPEDRLVGEAVVFSVETLLRHLGEVLQGRQACVLGYGKIGAGIAAALHARHVRVAVLDIDPVRQAQAIAVGYGTAELTDALGGADLVFSATGSRALGLRHLAQLKEGSFLAGATSRDDEFDLSGLGAGHVRIGVIPGVARITAPDGRSFFLLGNGNAVNFLHTSAMGPAIHLIKAEVTVAAALLAEEQLAAGFYEVSPAHRASIAAAWVDTFSSGPGRHL